MATIELYRAAKDDIVTDCASFAETLETARLYADNPGFGGCNLYRCALDTDAVRVLDLTDEDDPTAAAAEAIGHDHPGSIGADEYVPSISYQLRDAGYHWVRVCESYPADSITWIWVGGDDPEMDEVA